MNYKEAADKLKAYSRDFYEERKKRGHLTVEERLDEVVGWVGEGKFSSIPTVSLVGTHSSFYKRDGYNNLHR